MLAGLLKPDSGSATVIGFDPIKNDGALHAVLGYMPQKFGLYEDLTVMENLNLYADLRSVTGEARKQTFARLLEFTSLGPFTGRLAGKLSGGMKQKLGLACTLVGEPKVLLLDEPGVGVDPISRRELWQMVHELAGEGMLILWSTSYLDEAEQCRDVLLMNEGELLYQGEPKALTQIPGRTQLSDDQSTRGQPQTVATRLETAAGQRRHDSGKWVPSDPQKRGHTRRYSPCRRDAGNQHQRNYAAF
ncbi:ABC transporter ATP-binding protein [Escherichia coli]